MATGGTTNSGSDALTIGAVAVLAALAVTVSHEAIGHGGVCLAIGGRVTLLTSSLFQCSVPSGLTDLGGPLFNLAVGPAAAAASRVVGAGRPALKLFLILIAAFAGFWEGGYLAKAMLLADGDLYFAWANLVGPPGPLVRGAGAAAGLALYLGTVVFVARGLTSLAGSDARRLARIVWLAATTATVAAALFYRGGPGPNLRDTFLEIGAASLPLLLIQGRGADEATPEPIGRSRTVILLAVAVWVAFVLTQGRGLAG